MPIFRFVAVAGCLLLALLFVADATLKPRGPLFTNNSEGLTRPERVRTQTAQRAPEAQRAQEAPRPRAPALVPATTSQDVAPQVVWALSWRARSAASIFQYRAMLESLLG